MKRWSRFHADSTRDPFPLNTLHRGTTLRVLALLLALLVLAWLAYRDR